MKTHRERARELIDKMTLEEKASQLCAAWLEISADGTFTVKEIAFSREKPNHDRSYVLGRGIGQLTRPYGTQAQDPHATAKGINEIQRFLVEQTRLGIPAMLHEECLSGAMIRGCTIFPSSLNYASSWDDNLMERIGATIGNELRSLGVHQGLAPVLDVARDARWGRLEETFGEDPYLAGCMGSAYVKGLQGRDRNPLATLKHFVGHSFSEGGRNHAPVHMGERELHNIFALPFEMTVKAAEPGAVMPAYHDIDGEPCSSSRRLLTGLLRETWGFDGLVVADYEAPSLLHRDHQVAADMAEAAALALHAGMDVELPSSTAFKEGLVTAVERGLIETAELDAAVMRVLMEKFRLGLFDHPYIDVDSIVLSTEKSHELAVEAAAKSIVLLKNDGILPLPQNGTIAVIGPLADHPYAMFGGYSAPIHLQGLSTPEETVPKRAMTLKTAVESFSRHAAVLYEPGCMLYENPFEEAVFFPGDVKEDDQNSIPLPSTDTSRIALAAEAAEQADAVILVVGDMVGLFQHGTVGEGSDVTSLKLPGVQQQLIDAVLDTGKHVVLILISGRPYNIGKAAEKAAAILSAWLPGEGGGEAIAEILFGSVNPSAKTPLSFPKSAGVMPYAYNHVRKSSGLPKQRDFDALFPFGFGLSYTQFTYRDFTADAAEIPNDGVTHVSAVIENTGSCAGDEIVQLYVHDSYASVVRPVKELKGYVRVSLDPGASSRVTFTLSADMLSFISEGARKIEPGTFEIMLGSSSEDILWKQEITVTGSVRELPPDWKFLTSVHIQPL